MIPVEDAQARILAAFSPLPAELVALTDAHGRVLAQDVVARRTQPPFPAAAMDGYALRGADAATVGARLRIVGYAPAGKAYDGVIGPGEAVRIFTGAPVPEGADTIIIQEDAEEADGIVTIREPATFGRHIRREGLDFRGGDTVIAAGTRLTARHLALAAAANHPWLRVHRRPRVAILPTGDEVVLPGEPIGRDQIVSSNGIAIEALVTAAGGIPIQMGVAPDDPAALVALAQGAAGADLLVTTGGASVGDHDLIRSALGPSGFTLDFWKIAMRPGKPVVFGRLGTLPLLGLPGNPVSAVVCSLLVLIPALERLQGLPGNGLPIEKALAAVNLPANDRRQDYLRATLSIDSAGSVLASPLPLQDSSLTAALAEADALIIRPPFAESVPAGGPIQIIRLGTGTLPI